MECKVKITQVVIFFGLLLCSILLTVESAPTIENDRREIEPALHVLPLEQSATAGVSLSSVESSDTTTSSHIRSKRAIIFRPLFVYRQQQIKKQRVQSSLVPQTFR